MIRAKTIAPVTAFLAVSGLLAACAPQQQAPAASSAAAVGTIVQVAGVAMNDLTDLKVLAAMAANVSETARACAIGTEEVDGEIARIDTGLPDLAGQKGWFMAEYQAKRTANRRADNDLNCAANEKERVVPMVQRLASDLRGQALADWLAARKAAR